MSKQRRKSSLPTSCPLPLGMNSLRGGTDSSRHVLHSYVQFYVHYFGIEWNCAAHTLWQLAFFTYWAVPFLLVPHLHCALARSSFNQPLTINKGFASDFHYYQHCPGEHPCAVALHRCTSGCGRGLGEQGTARWPCGERQTPTDTEWLLPGPGTGQWLQGVEVLRALVGGIRDLTDPCRKPHQEEAQGLGRLLRTLKPCPCMRMPASWGSPEVSHNPRPSLTSLPCVLRSSPPRAVLGKDCVSSWGHRLLSPEIRYLPPTLHPAVSRELSSLSSPSCSPDPGSSLGDGKGSFPACGPDARWYAFLLFQHVVKLITLGNDFLTVLGKEKEGGKKRPLKKNEP